MLHEFLLTCYYLSPFLLPFFGIAGALTMIVEVVTHG